MVTLRASTDADVDLEIALETDPVAMAELGGPRPEAAVRDVHVRRMREPYWFVIDDNGEAVGTIGAWADETGADVAEAGWMVLPAHHGRGIASAALRLLIERLRQDNAFRALDANPGVANAPSNRLCEKHGFDLHGAVDVEYAGRVLRCNHWRLALT